MAGVPTLKHYVPSFDGLRGIAILAVMLVHSSYGWLSGGFIGVDLFFVLSGYLITGLLLNEYAASGTLRLDLFYWRRFYRLAPALLIAFALAYGLGLFVPHDRLQIGHALLLLVTLFFVNILPISQEPLPVLWSLAVEEQFYLFWPRSLLFLLRKQSGRFLVPVVVGLIIFAAALRAGMYWHGYREHLLYEFTFARIDSLLMGVLAAVVCEWDRVKAMISIFVQGRGPEIFLLMFCVSLRKLDGADAMLYWGGFTVIAFGSALMLLSLTQAPRRTFLVAVLESAPLRWLGKRSYGVYLYHLPIVWALEPLRVRHSLPNLILVSFLRLAVPIAVAALSYRLVELPFLKRKSVLQWSKAAVRVDQEGLGEKEIPSAPA